MIKKKGPSACDTRACEGGKEVWRAFYSAPAFESQLTFLRRHFGLEPRLAAVVARLAFGEARP